MHVGSLAPSTSHPPFLFAGEALHPPLLCALTFAPHLFFAGLALHPPSALRPQLCTPPLFCGLSFAGIKGFPKLKSLNSLFSTTLHCNLIRVMFKSKLSKSWIFIGSGAEKWLSHCDCRKLQKARGQFSLRMCLSFKAAQPEVLSLQLKSG